MNSFGFSEKLALAIIERALLDYKMLRESGIDYAEESRLVFSCEEIERFFESAWGKKLLRSLGVKDEDTISDFLKSYRPPVKIRRRCYKRKQL